MTKQLIGLGLALAAGCGSGRAQPVDYYVDQRHDFTREVEGIHSLQSLAPVMQEFTPTVGALDIAEIWTQDFGLPNGNGLGATLELRLRENPPDGPVLAVSAPITLPDGWDGPTRFEFAEKLPLVPGQRYALEPRVVTGDNWGVNSHGSLFPPTYAGGRYFIAGQSVESIDMWFRTGVRVPSPRLHLEKEGTLRWQGIEGLRYRVWASPNLKDWSELGLHFAGSTNCTFKVPLPASAPQFFRVSQ